MATGYVAWTVAVVKSFERQTGNRCDLPFRPCRRRVRILLVDDQPVIRRGLRMWLELEPDFEIVGEAASGAEALSAAAALRPDVVLMDVEMPQMDGVTATVALRRMVPEAIVIVLSMHADAPTRTRALDAGAAAFLSKGTSDLELLTTIRRFSPSRD